MKKNQTSLANAYVFLIMSFSRNHIWIIFLTLQLSTSFYGISMKVVYFTIIVIITAIVIIILVNVLVYLYTKI